MTIEEIARVLYECERKRGEIANSVMSAATGKEITGCTMEPWDECKDAFLSDARAVFSLLSSPGNMGLVMERLGGVAGELLGDADNLSPTNNVYPASVMRKYAAEITTIAGDLRSALEGKERELSDAHSLLRITKEHRDSTVRMLDAAMMDISTVREQALEEAAKVNDARAAHARATAATLTEHYQSTAHDCMIALAESHEATAKLIRTEKDKT